MSELISIIIPVYNGEREIEKCLSSIFDQTYKNYEVVVVNDGSTDKTLEILKKYKEKYKRKVNIINQKNKGQAVARNNGIKKVKGKYITFLDADDYFDKNFLKKLYDNIGENDFIISGYKRLQGNDIIFEKIPKKNSWTKYKFTSTCAKLYRTEFIINNGLEFPSLRIGEDVYFTISAIASTNKIGILDYAGYMNISNCNSVTHTVSKENMSSILTVLNKIENNLNKRYLDTNDKLFFYTKSVVLDIITHKDILSKKEFVNEYRKNFKWLEDTYKNNSHRLCLQMMQGEDRYINLSINLFIICYKIHMEYIVYFILKLFLKGGIK